MLDIHEFLLDGVFPSGCGEVGILSELERPSRAGRFEDVRAAGGMLIEGGTGCCSLSTGRVGSVRRFSVCSCAEPSRGGTFGTASRGKAGEDGACWR